MIDLTVLTDSELFDLFQRISAEKERRIKFRQAKKSIVEITQGYLDVGGKKEDLLDAIDEGEAAKIKADSQSLETLSSEGTVDEFTG